MTSTFEKRFVLFGAKKGDKGKVSEQVEFIGVSPMILQEARELVSRKDHLTLRAMCTIGHNAHDLAQFSFSVRGWKQRDGGKSYLAFNILQEDIWWLEGAYTTQKAARAVKSDLIAWAWHTGEAYTRKFKQPSYDPLWLE